MIKINLLAEGRRPAAVRRREPAASFLQGQNAAAILMVVVLLLAGLLPAGGWWWYKKHQVAENDLAIAEAQREVDELAAIIKEVEQYKAKQTELEHKISVIKDLRRNQRGPVHVMDAISNSLPELLWLDSMQVSATSITLNGRAFNTNAIASFVENLDSVPEFQEPTLRDVQRGAGGVYSFSVIFQYRFPDLQADEDEDPAGDDADVSAEAAGG